MKKRYPAPHFDARDIPMKIVGSPLFWLGALAIATAACTANGVQFPVTDINTLVTLVPTLTPTLIPTPLPTNTALPTLPALDAFGKCVRIEPGDSIAPALDYPPLTLFHVSTLITIFPSMANNAQFNVQNSFPTIELKNQVVQPNDVACWTVLPIRQPLSPIYRSSKPKLSPTLIPRQIQHR